MPIGSCLSALLHHSRGPIALAITLGTGGTGWTAAESVCPAPIATCALPAATRLPESIATYFHTGGIVTRTGLMETECAEPIATCIHPAPNVARLPGTGLFWQTEHRATVTELLQSWSVASNTHPTWSATEKNWLARRHQPWLSAVALDAVVRLACSVKEADLTRDFTWTHESTRDDVAVLRAVPTDETQRLFCPQLRVELDATTHALTAIDVADRAGTWRPIDLPWAVLPKPSRTETFVLNAAKYEFEVVSGDAAIEGVEIELTSGFIAEDLPELPPSPTTAPALRFVAERLEFNVTTPR